MLRRFVLLLSLVFAAAAPASAQTFTRLTHQPPGGALITFQMTDGTVLAQANSESDWYRLTPDINGSYLNGTWTKMASLPSGYQPLYFSQAVLADGRLVIIGGEYNHNTFAFTNLGAVYDPVANTWTPLKAPKGFNYIGDSPGVVLPDGRFLLGAKFKKIMAALDPATLKWTAMPVKGKNDFNAEEGWTLLPDGTFLAVDVKDHPRSERYLPEKGKWVNAGDIPADLWEPQNCCGCIPYDPNKPCYQPPGEIGPAILRPDGTVFATGGLATGNGRAHTDIWTPPSNNDKHGHWTAGPDFPANEDSGDCYGSLLTNGNVLVQTLDGSLYEFDGTNLTHEPFNGAGGNLMVLPSGETLVGGFAVYKSTGSYDPSWAPAISSSPSTVTRGSSYQISGTQFNGLSRANSFGDEDDSATNYPLVRIQNNSTGHVFYARTHDHSTMGVATGAAIVSTHFDVSAATETGASTLVVVANGIPSAPVAVTVN
ncbi:MAG TPA: hypothetical protein VHE09_08270 [Rhizomicrobium sp.]|jgi:hypothetical protein|nr:hypothetical protein [Rhizomicrobium sp.]